MNPDLLKQGPGPRLALIEGANAQHIAETLVAFANAEGGLLVVGVSDDGKPTDGPLESEALEDALKAAELLVQPDRRHRQLGGGDDRRQPGVQPARAAIHRAALADRRPRADPWRRAESPRGRSGAAAARQRQDHRRFRGNLTHRRDQRGFQ
ncbi:MAG: ATP-binding protein [Chloroflexi bacterium]|nr:ATP-binding protein [Chloroflexota bacterium]